MAEQRETKNNLKKEHNSPLPTYCFYPWQSSAPADTIRQPFLWHHLPQLSPTWTGTPQHLSLLIMKQSNHMCKFDSHLRIWNIHTCGCGPEHDFKGSREVSFLCAVWRWKSSPPINSYKLVERDLFISAWYIFGCRHCKNNPVGGGPTNGNGKLEGKCAWKARGDISARCQSTISRPYALVRVASRPITDVQCSRSASGASSSPLPDHIYCCYLQCARQSF